MRFLNAIRVSHCRNKPPLLSSFHSKLTGSSFGIAFDIDGVILRGRAPIGGAPQALRKLYDDSGALKLPFLFLTNGGGIPETRRAADLSKILGVNILPAQVVQGHTPFKNLLRRYENDLIIATGKGEPAEVMASYGFKKVLSLEEYATHFENIDPVSQYKNWTVEHAVTKKSIYKELGTKYNVFTDRVQAAFVISDPVDWGRDIQVLCDILTSGGLPGLKNGHQPDLYFAADDLEYQAAFPSERLGMGAFRIALESVFNSIHHHTLQYVSYGKPNPFVFKNAEAILNQLHLSFVDEGAPLRNLYMIGDNPPVDIKGAQKAGHPWFSILTRTGVFRGKDNDEDYPADMVVDTVEEAVDFILNRECSS